MISVFEVQGTEEHPEGYVRGFPEVLLPRKWEEHFRHFKMLACLLGAWKALRGDGTEAETERDKKEPVR